MSGAISHAAAAAAASHSLSLYSPSHRQSDFSNPRISSSLQERMREGGEEGRGEGSASLKTVSLVRARCKTLHKHCAAKLCLPKVASFKRVQPHLFVRHHRHHHHNVEHSIAVGAAQLRTRGGSQT